MKKEVESLEKNRPCLTRMPTPPLGCESSGEREPDQERVQFNSRTECVEIWKDEEELACYG